MKPRLWRLPALKHRALTQEFQIRSLRLLSRAGMGLAAHPAIKAIGRALVLRAVGARLENRVHSGWCGRPGSNRHGQSPTDFRTTSTFAAARRRSWSGLSLRHSPKALDAARLVSTPSRPKAGLARDRHLTGFPDFERFYVRDFPRRTQSSA